MNDKLIMKDGKPHKIAQVIMLPTEKESKLYKYGSPPVILAFSNFTQKATYGNYEIYILSDEEIKEGDWTEFEGEVKQAGKAMLEYLNSSGDEAFKKIIATTDEALTYKISVDCGSSIGNTLHTKNLPRPSDDFLKAFVKAQGKITEVLVEWEFDIHKQPFAIGSNPKHYKIKVSPDNTITIKPVTTVIVSEKAVPFVTEALGFNPFEEKTSWSQEEVKELMESWMVLPKTPESINKWIKENL